MDLISNAYRGPPNIPHVTEEFFKYVFVSSNLAFTVLCLPGRFLGTEVRARRYHRDFLMKACESRAVMRQIRRGKEPTFLYNAPTITEHSWPRMWDRHLHWKRWALERTGPVHGST